MESQSQDRSELPLTKDKPFFRDTLLQVPAECGINFYLALETF